MPTSPKRTPSTTTETREAAPRPSRGASAIPAPRKAELHRVNPATRPLPSHDQIARRAYELWILSGYVTGRDSENWAQAERELSTGCTTSDGSAAQQA